MSLTKSFFDFVSDNKNDNLFSIFMNKNSRDANYYLLKECFDIIKSKTDAQINKDELIDDLVKFTKENDLFKDYNKFDDYFDNTNDEKIRNILDFVRIKIRRFVDTGWLIEDQSRNEIFTKYILLNEYTRPIFESMIGIASSDKNPPEYSTNLLVINDSLDKLLSNDSQTNLYSYYVNVIEHTEKLKSQLSSSSSRIRRYINRINNNEDLNKLIEDFINGYNVKIARPFYNFRLKDKPAIMQGIILNKFDKLLNNGNAISKIVENSLDRQGILNKNTVEYQNAYNNERALINENLSKCFSYLKTLLEVIDSIDFKDNNYISSAKTKIEYKSSDYHDLRDEINNVIDLIKKSNLNDFVLEDNLVHLRNIDALSLKKPAKYSTKLDEIIVNVNTLTVEEENKLKKELYNEFKNDFNRIYKKLYVLNLNEVEALTLINNYEFNEYEIFMLYLHSTDLNFEYKIEVTNEIIHKDYFKFYNFILRRQ